MHKPAAIRIITAAHKTSILKVNLHAKAGITILYTSSAWLRASRSRPADIDCTPKEDGHSEIIPIGANIIKYIEAHIIRRRIQIDMSPNWYDMSIMLPYMSLFSNILLVFTHLLSYDNNRSSNYAS